MKFVRNKREAWRWFSVWAMAAQGAVGTAWLAVPDDFRSAVPSEWLATAAIVLTFLGIGGRMVKQGDDNGRD